MDIIQFLDRSAFTDSLSRFDLVQKAIHEGIKWNKFRGKTSFRAKVLTMPIRLAGVDTTPLVDDAEGGQVAKKGNKIAFKGRILGDPSPHDWLIDPCDLDTATDPGLVLRMTALHTTFESANDIVVSEATMPKMGDIVNIELTPNVFWYNLSFGKFTSIANQAAPGSEGPAESAGAACDSLESFFENIEYEDLKGGGSSFEYSVGGSGGVGYNYTAAAGATASLGAVDFYKLLKGSFLSNDYSDAFVAGLVANAQAESNFLATANGDLRGDVGGNSEQAIQVGSNHYCSFGYWQLNVCSGGGEKFAKRQGITDIVNNKEKLYKLITDSKTQIEYMVEYMKDLFGADVKKSNLTAEYWGRRIAVEFERCSRCKAYGSGGDATSTVKRGAIAKDLYEKI